MLHSRHSAFEYKRIDCMPIAVVCTVYQLSCLVKDVCHFVESNERAHTRPQYLTCLALQLALNQLCL